MPKVLKGKVVAIKNPKTVTVEISNLHLHSCYLKPIKRTKKLQVHNEDFTLRAGDTVFLKNKRPFSATKSFLVVGIEEKTKTS